MGNLTKSSEHIEKIAIVIPCYNGSPHIARAVHSVLNQTYGFWRLVVVDDGSTDHSAEIVRSFEDPRITLIQQDNQGVSAARNHGVRVATTEWVAFLDADDEWVPSFLEETMAAVGKFTNAIAVFTDYRVSPPGNSGLAHLPQVPILLDDYFGFVLTHRRGMCSSASIVKKSALDRVGGFPVGVTHGEDLDTWARLSWIGGIVCIPKPLAVYNADTPNSAMKIPVENRILTPRIWLSYGEWLRGGLIPREKLSNTERYVAYKMFWYVIDLIYWKRKREAQEIVVELGPLGMPRQRRLILNFLMLAPGRTGAILWKVADRIRTGLRKRGLNAKMGA